MFPNFIHSIGFLIALFIAQLGWAQSVFLTGIEPPEYMNSFGSGIFLNDDAGLNVMGSFEFDAESFEAAADAGSIFLPVANGIAFANGPTSMDWREMVLVDRASGQIWDDPLNQFLGYDMYTFQESDGDLAAAVVMSDGNFGIVQFHEYRDAWDQTANDVMVWYPAPAGSPHGGQYGAPRDRSLAQLLATAGSPTPISMACEETSSDESSDGPQTAEIPASLVVTSNGVQALLNSVAYSEAVRAMIPASMHLSTHALLYSALANGIMRSELGLVLRPQMVLQITDAQVNNVDTYAPATSSQAILTDTLRWPSLAVDNQVTLSNPGFFVDFGHNFLYGGGGVATNSSACNTATTGTKYRGVTRMDWVFDMFDLMVYVHEMGHQMSASHTFNANQTNSTITSTQRTATSAYEAGSGYTLMAYMHQCPETYAVPGGGTATANHRVAGRARNRMSRTPIWEEHYADIRYKFHTHSLEQITTFVQNNCPSRPAANAIGPLPVLDLQHGTSEVSQGGAKNVPLGKPVMLAVEPEPNTEYRWHQMDLGPMDAWPDILAMQNDPVGPKVSVNGPTKDGLAFIPARDVLLSGYIPNHHFSQLCANPNDNYNFRVQGNRFVAMGANPGSVGQAAISASGLVGINCVSPGQDFELTSGPWDLPSTETWAITELGSGSDEALYQFEIDWNIAGTTGAPFNSDKVDIYRIVGEDASTLELLFANFPNEGGAVLELPPSPVLEDGSIAEQRILIKLPDEVWFDLSPPFTIFYAGCTDINYPTYDPQANVDNPEDCNFGPWPLDDPINPFSGDPCKDIDACNYNEDAIMHDPSTCKYPVCEDPEALNFSWASTFVLADVCPGGECVYDAVECTDEVWLDPADNTQGWGFRGPWAPEIWDVQRPYPVGMPELGHYESYEANLNSDLQDFGGVLRFNQFNNRLHGLVGAESGEYRSIIFRTEIPRSGAVTFDFQAIESTQSNHTNLRFFVGGDYVHFDQMIEFGAENSEVNNWVVGDDIAPATGTISVEVAAGDDFMVLLTTNAPDLSPVGVVLSDFRYDYDVVTGCMTSNALNYNPFATCQDDVDCIYPEDIASGHRCHDPAACNYSLPLPNTFHSPNLCEYPGCLVESAANYDPFAGCNGPCCFTGDCLLEEGEEGPILWYDVNEVWEEYDPIPGFDEVMYLPGSLVMQSPQTAEQVSQSVSYFFPGDDVSTVSFMYAWVPGVMYLPGDMLSPARVEVWKEGVMVYESALDESAGEALVPGGDFPNQAFGMPLAAWPGDPFNMNPYLADGSLLQVNETMPSFEGTFRAMSIDVTPGSEVRIKMASDSQDMVEDDQPCRLFITGMRVDQSCGAPGIPATQGCMDVTACNYDPAANIDDGTCETAGCMDSAAENYNPNAVCQTACFYDGDCALMLTPDSTVAFGFNGAFAPGYAVENTVPANLLSIANNLMVIVGPDQQFAGSYGAPASHEISWVAQEDMEVQFVYAAASWDNDYTYDRGYYRWNSEEVVLDANAGEPLDVGTWLVDHPDWNPGPDYAMPALQDIPYAGFEDNLAVDLHLLKTPIPLQAGDTLTLGVESDDNGYGEVAMAVMTLVWSAHCAETPDHIEIVGCKDFEACNFDPQVDINDPSACIYPGMPCEDYDACTYEDVVQDDCTCAGSFVDSDDDGVCNVEDECPTNPDLTEEGPCGCDTPADNNGNNVIDCMEFCEVDADGDGVCVENDCDDNDPTNPDPITGECSLICGCMNPVAANYNPDAVCSSACVFDDACDLINLGETADGLPVGLGFRGAYAESFVAWNYADPWNNQAAGATDISLELSGDADQTHFLVGPSTLTTEGSFGFRMPVSGTFAFTWSFVHGSSDLNRSLAWVEVGSDRTYLPITETGLAPDATTVLPADWYAPMDLSAMAGAAHAAHFNSPMYNAEEWCGISLPVDVSTLEGASSANWSSQDSEGTSFPWTAGEPLGEFAPLLFPEMPAGFTGMATEIGGGYHKPVVVRANAGEYVSFHIGYNAGYASGATGALVISSPMWLNNCGAEPCDAPYEPLCPADVDGNGVVAVSDLLLVLADFGNSCE